MTNQPPLKVTVSDLNRLAGVVILAGGLSTRMGSPKALLTLPSGETLLDYHVNKARQLGVPILIADNEQGFSSRINNSNEVIAIEDYQPHSSNPQAEHKHSAGPLGAILSAMQQLLIKPSDNTSLKVAYEKKSQWLVVVSCDSLVTATDIWQYIDINYEAGSQASDNQQAKVYCLSDQASDKPRLYPLLGVYSLSLTESLKAYLDAGERRVMAFIKPKGHSVLMPQAWYDLSNLNTPEQFQQACQSL